jgi:hypothetical protein
MWHFHPAPASQRDSRRGHPSLFAIRNTDECYLIIHRSRRSINARFIWVQDPQEIVKPCYLGHLQEVIMNQPSSVGLVRPPPGVVPNFENPESTGYKVIITAVVTWALATSIVCLRAYVKLTIIRKMNINDCTAHTLFGWFSQY